MLSQTYQMNAYKALVAAGGLIMPASSISASSAASNAASISKVLAAMLLETVSYPSSVSDQTALILTWSKALSDTASNATGYAALLNQYADPSVLIQLTNGWDIHCRANDLSPRELTISAVIGDDTEPAALGSVLATLDTTSLAKAMKDINATLSAAVTSNSSGTATATAAPALSEAQITALTSAAEAFAAPISAVVTANNALTVRFNAAQESAKQAEDAFNSAISVALISSSISSTAVASAVSAITPASVLAILKEGSS